jgi:hypothetical protein
MPLPELKINPETAKSSAWDLELGTRDLQRSAF